MNLANIFVRWGVVLKKNGLNPRANTDDFGNDLRQILLACEIDTRKMALLKSQMAKKTIFEGITFLNTPQNFKQIADHLGINVTESGTFYYVRDNFVRLVNLEVRSSKNSFHTQMAIDRVHSKNLYLDQSAVTRTRNQLFNHWSGYSGNYEQEARKDGEKLFQGVYRPFQHLYVEGGNVLTVTNQEGDVVVLIGDDHRLQTLLILELGKQNWVQLAEKVNIQTPFNELVEKIALNLSLEEIKAICLEMFALGLWECNGKSGLISSQGQLSLLLVKFFMPGPSGWVISEEERGWYRTLAEESHVVSKFQMDDCEAENAREVAASFLAKKEVTEALIAAELHVPQKNVHYIPQVYYHLDAFLFSGPDQSIFLQDFGVCAGLIEGILADRDKEISVKDKQLLEGYLATAAKMDRELGDLLKKVVIQLKQAGLQVIPTPGHFLFEQEGMYQEFPLPSEGISINFMNGVSGWSSKLGKFYYITHGLHAGDTVGSLIMDAFSLFLKHYIDDLLVYYIGHDSKNLKDYSEALDFWSRLDTQSGIHCTTFPIH